MTRLLNETRTRGCLWLLVLCLFLPALAGAEFRLKPVKGAGKFLGGFAFLEDPRMAAFLGRRVQHFLRTGVAHYSPEDDSGAWAHVLLRRHGTVRHGWVLVSGVLRGPGFEGLELVFLMTTTGNDVRVLYAQESGSAVLAQVHPDPTGESVYLGRDWFFADTCFSRFRVCPDGPVRDDGFERLSRFAHRIARRHVKTDSAGAAPWFFHPRTSTPGYRVHVHDMSTPVVCEVGFALTTGQIRIRRAGQEGETVVSLFRGMGW